MKRAARRPIPKGKTLAERKAARQGINLRGLGISPQTEQRYVGAMASLLPCIESAGNLEELDILCEEFIECEWEKGTPLGRIGDALCGLRYFWPQVKGHLRGA